MKHIILTEEEKNKMMSFRSTVADILAMRLVDVNPILIKDGTYILPVKILVDTAYIDLIPQLVTAYPELKGLPQREILDSELIQQQTDL